MGELILLAWISIELAIIMGATIEIAWKLK